MSVVLLVGIILILVFAVFVYLYILRKTNNDPGISDGGFKSIPRLPNANIIASKRPDTFMYETMDMKDVYFYDFPDNIDESQEREFISDATKPYSPARQGYDVSSESYQEYDEEEFGSQDILNGSPSVSVLRSQSSSRSSVSRNDDEVPLVESPEVIQSPPAIHSPSPVRSASPQRIHEEGSQEFVGQNESQGVYDNLEPIIYESPQKEESKSWTDYFLTLMGLRSQTPARITFQPSQSDKLLSESQPSIRTELDPLISDQLAYDPSRPVVLPRAVWNEKYIRDLQGVSWSQERFQDQTVDEEEPYLITYRQENTPTPVDKEQNTQVQNQPSQEFLYSPPDVYVQEYQPQETETTPYMFDAMTAAWSPPREQVIAQPVPFDYKPGAQSGRRYLPSKVVSQTPQSARRTRPGDESVDLSNWMPYNDEVLDLSDWMPYSDVLDLSDRTAYNDNVFDLSELKAYQPNVTPDLSGPKSVSSYRGSTPFQAFHLSPPRTVLSEGETPLRSQSQQVGGRSQIRGTSELRKATPHVEHREQLKEPVITRGQNISPTLVNDMQTINLNETKQSPSSNTRTENTYIPKPGGKKQMFPFGDLWLRELANKNPSVTTSQPVFGPSNQSYVPPESPRYDYQVLPEQPPISQTQSPITFGPENQSITQVMVGKDSSRTPRVRSNTRFTTNSPKQPPGKRLATEQFSNRNKLLSPEEPFNPSMPTPLSQEQFNAPVQTLEQFNPSNPTYYGPDKPVNFTPPPQSPNVSAQPFPSPYGRARVLLDIPPVPQVNTYAPVTTYAGTPMQPFSQPIAHPESRRYGDDELGDKMARNYWLNQATQSNTVPRTSEQSVLTPAQPMTEQQSYAMVPTGSSSRSSPFKPSANKGALPTFTIDQDVLDQLNNAWSGKRSKQYSVVRQKQSRPQTQDERKPKQQKTNLVEEYEPQNTDEFVAMSFGSGPVIETIFLKEENSPSKQEQQADIIFDKLKVKNARITFVLTQRYAEHLMRLMENRVSQEPSDYIPASFEREEELKYQSPIQEIQEPFVIPTPTKQKSARRRKKQQPNETPQLPYKNDPHAITPPEWNFTPWPTSRFNYQVSTPSQQGIYGHSSQRVVSDRNVQSSGLVTFGPSTQQETLSSLKRKAGDEQDTKVENEQGTEDDNLHVHKSHVIWVVDKEEDEQEVPEIKTAGSDIHELQNEDPVTVKNVAMDQRMANKEALDEEEGEERDEETKEISIEKSTMETDELKETPTRDKPNNKRQSELQSQSINKKGAPSKHRKEKRFLETQSLEDTTKKPKETRGISNNPIGTKANVRNLHPKLTQTKASLLKNTQLRKPIAARPSTTQQTQQRLLPLKEDKPMEKDAINPQPTEETPVSLIPSPLKNLPEIITPPVVWNANALAAIAIKPNDEKTSVLGKTARSPIIDKSNSPELKKKQLVSTSSPQASPIHVIQPADQPLPLDMFPDEIAESTNLGLASSAIATGIGAMSRSLSPDSKSMIVRTSMSPDLISSSERMPSIASQSPEKSRSHPNPLVEFTQDNVSNLTGYGRPGQRRQQYLSGVHPYKRPNRKQTRNDSPELLYPPETIMNPIVSTPSEPPLRKQQNREQKPTPKQIRLEQARAREITPSNVMGTTPSQSQSSSDRSSSSVRSARTPSPKQKLDSPAKEIDESSLTSSSQSSVSASPTHQPYVSQTIQGTDEQTVMMMNQKQKGKDVKAHKYPSKLEEIASERQNVVEIAGNPFLIRNTQEEQKKSVIRKQIPREDVRQHSPPTERIAKRAAVQTSSEETMPVKSPLSLVHESTDYQVDYPIDSYNPLVNQMAFTPNQFSMRTETSPTTIPPPIRLSEDEWKRVDMQLNQAASVPLPAEDDVLDDTMTIPLLHPEQNQFIARQITKSYSAKQTKPKQKWERTYKSAEREGNPRSSIKPLPSAMRAQIDQMERWDQEVIPYGQVQALSDEDLRRIANEDPEYESAPSTIAKKQSESPSNNPKGKHTLSTGNPLMKYPIEVVTEGGDDPEDIRTPWENVDYHSIAQLEGDDPEEEVKGDPVRIVPKGKRALNVEETRNENRPQVRPKDKQETTMANKQTVKENRAQVRPRDEQETFDIIQPSEKNLRAQDNVTFKRVFVPGVVQDNIGRRAKKANLRLTKQTRKQVSVVDKNIDEQLPDIPRSDSAEKEDQQERDITKRSKKEEDYFSEDDTPEREYKEAVSKALREALSEQDSYGDEWKTSESNEDFLITLDNSKHIINQPKESDPYQWNVATDPGWESRHQQSYFEQPQMYEVPPTQNYQPQFEFQRQPSPLRPTETFIAEQFVEPDEDMDQYVKEETMKQAQRKDTSKAGQRVFKKNVSPKQDQRLDAFMKKQKQKRQSKTQIQKLLETQPIYRQKQVEDFMREAATHFKPMRRHFATKQDFINAKEAFTVEEAQRLHKEYLKANYDRGQRVEAYKPSV